MKLRKNLIGKQFGKLIVISKVPNKHGRVRWKCKCVCGKIKIFWAGNLRTKLSKSCGCNRNKNGKENPTWKGYGDISSRQFSGIKKGAQNRKIQFSISIVELWKLFLRQNRKCALSKLPLSLSRKEGITASVDRIDNTLGYVKGNVQWVHQDINFMKQDFTQSEFIRYCQLISKNT